MSPTEEKDKLAAFMKKKAKKEVKNNQKSLSNNLEEGLSDEEELERAKKNSEYLASQADQSRMVKKLLFQIIAKYTIVIILFATAAYGIIEGLPRLFKILHSMIISLILS